MKRFNQLGERASADGSEIHHQFAQNRLPHEGGLPQNEPKMLERWEQMGLYERIRQARKGKPKYILHDGPPYTSGPIHLGTAMNKCLKDFIVKSRTMSGFDAPYVPGWDCHGLPIEIKVDQNLAARSWRCTRSTCAPSAASTRRSSSTCSASSSSASASSAASTSPTPP
jgi:isoleucyl-tRNA synthetase